MPMEEKANPNSQGNCGEQGTVTISQRLGAALHSTTSHDTYTVYRSHIPIRVSRIIFSGTQRSRLRLIAQQDQAHSMPVAASPGSQDPALPLLSKTEPSQVLKTSTQVSRRASQETYVKYRSRIPVRASRVVSTGIQSSHLWLTAQQDWAHRLPVTAPLGKQYPALPLLHVEKNISSTYLPGPENEKGLSVISQTEPSHMLETSTQVGRRASQVTYVKYRSRVPVRVSRIVFTGIKRPSQRLIAQQDQAHSMLVAASPGNQGPALPLLSKTEPSQVLKTSTQVGHQAFQKTYVNYRSRIPVQVSGVVFTGIQSSHLRLTAQQDQAHRLPVTAPLDKQYPALPLLHVEENISSTHLPGPEKNEKGLSVTSQTEPSHMLKTSTQVGRRTSQETYVKYRSRIPVRVSRTVSTGIQRPCLRLTAWQNRAHRLPVSGRPGRLPRIWCQRQVSVQVPAVTWVQMRQNFTGTSLPMPGKPGEYLTTMSQRLAAQELNTRHLASEEHRLLSEARSVLQKLEKIPSHQRVLDWLKANFPDQCGVLAKEEKQEENRPQELCQGSEISDKKMSQVEDRGSQELLQREYYTDETLSQAEKGNEKELSQEKGSNDKELSQKENDAIWDNTLGPVNEWVPSSFSRLGPGAGAEAVPGMYSASPATASPTGSKPAGAARARAPKEEHGAPQAPKAQEDAKAASPAFGEQVTAAGTESQEAARHSPCSTLSPLSTRPEAPGLRRMQAVHRQHPSRFWRVLWVLVRLCRCACITGWSDH